MVIIIFGSIAVGDVGPGPVPARRVAGQLRRLPRHQLHRPAVPQGAGGRHRPRHRLRPPPGRRLPRGPAHGPAPAPDPSRAAAVVTVSEFTRDELLDWQPHLADRITVIPNGSHARAAAVEAGPPPRRARPTPSCSAPSSPARTCPSPSTPSASCATAGSTCGWCWPAGAATYRPARHAPRAGPGQPRGGLHRLRRRRPGRVADGRGPHAGLPLALRGLRDAAAGGHAGRACRSSPPGPGPRPRRWATPACWSTPGDAEGFADAMAQLVVRRRAAGHAHQGRDGPGPPSSPGSGPPRPACACTARWPPERTDAPGARLQVVVVAEQLRRPVPGGIGTYVRGLLGGLRRRSTERVDVTLWASRRPGGRGPTRSPPSGRVVTSTLPGPRPHPGLGPGPVPAARPGADVVHATSLAVPPPGPAPMSVMVHDLAWRHEPDAYPRRGRDWHEAALGRAAEPGAAPAGPVGRHRRRPGRGGRARGPGGGGRGGLRPPRRPRPTRRRRRPPGRAWAWAGRTVPADRLHPRAPQEPAPAARRLRPRPGPACPSRGRWWWSARRAGARRCDPGPRRAAGRAGDAGGVLSALYAGARLLAYVPLPGGLGAAGGGGHGVRARRWWPARCRARAGRRSRCPRRRRRHRRRPGGGGERRGRPGPAGDRRPAAGRPG